MRVEFRSVSKSFGAVRALDDLDLELPAGSRFALIGPNGSGKSTLIRVMMGMLTCEGEVALDGRSPHGQRAALAGEMAYVPQIAPRLAATVGQLILATARLRDLPVESIEEAAIDLGLDVAALRRRPFRNLSGGMRQKVLAAMALATPARLLVLDEPTASMDADSRARFFERVAALPGRPTIVLCSHRLEEIRHLVEHVAVLEAGRLVWDGEVDEWLRREATSVVELLAAGDAAERWLGEQGFRRGGTGWWTRRIENAERPEFVRRVTSELGASLSDIVVRDIEDLAGSRRNGHSTDR